MFRYFLALLFLCMPSLLHARDCEAVLVEQVGALSLNDQRSETWLRLVNESNYQAAKQGASASVYGGWFSGDYQNFNAKRSSYFSQTGSSTARSTLLETYKSYLSDSQIAAWLDCEQGTTKIKTYYRDVDRGAATIIVVWDAPDFVGGLSDAKLTFADGTTRDLPSDENGQFRGETAFVVARGSQNAPIRGVVTGRAGVNNHNFQSTVFVSPVANPVQVEPWPLKEAVRLDGKVITSIAYWAGRNRSNQWNCFPSQANSMDLVVDGTSTRSLGRRRGACVGRGSYCDSHNESCDDVVVNRGCYVSRAWHARWKQEIARMGLPYRQSDVCDRDVVTLANYRS